MNADKVELGIPIQSFELFRDKLIDGDLNKIASPLREDKVEEADLIADEGSPTQLEAAIRSSERDYFRPDVGTKQLRDMELVGTLISLNKESNRGTLRLAGGNIPYHYVGDHIELFHMQFAHKGPVRISGVAEFDESGIIRSVEIMSANLMQQELGFP